MCVCFKCLFYIRLGDLAALKHQAEAVLSLQRPSPSPSPATIPIHHDHAHHNNDVTSSSPAPLSATTGIPTPKASTTSRSPSHSKLAPAQSTVPSTEPASHQQLSYPSSFAPTLVSSSSPEPQTVLTDSSLSHSKTSLLHHPASNFLSSQSVVEPTRHSPSRHVSTNSVHSHSSHGVDSQTQTTLPLTEENLAQHTHAASPFRILPRKSPATTFHAISSQSPSPSIVRPSASISNVPSRSKSISEKSVEEKRDKHFSPSASTVSSLKRSDSVSSRRNAYASPRKKKSERRTSVSSHASRHNRSRTLNSVTHPHTANMAKSRSTLPRVSVSSQTPSSSLSQKHAAKRKNSGMSDISALSTTPSNMSVSEATTAPQTPHASDSTGNAVVDGSPSLVNSSLVGRHRRTDSVETSTSSVPFDPNSMDPRDLKARLEQEMLRRQISEARLQISEETVRSLQLRRMVIGLGDLPSGASPGRSSFDSLCLERRASLGGASFASSSVCFSRSLFFLILL